MVKAIKGVVLTFPPAEVSQQLKLLRHNTCISKDVGNYDVDFRDYTFFFSLIKDFECS